MTARLRAPARALLFLGVLAALYGIWIAVGLPPLPDSVLPLPQARAATSTTVRVPGSDARGLMPFPIAARLRPAAAAASDRACR